MGVPHNEIQELSITENRAMSADFFSADMEVKYHDMCGIQFVWAGADAVTGEVIPQASLDRVNWCDLATGTAIKKVDAATGCQIYSIEPVTFAWLRIKFKANTNTTGTITTFVLAKRRRGNG